MHTMPSLSCHIAGQTDRSLPAYPALQFRCSNPRFKSQSEHRRSYGATDGRAWVKVRGPTSEPGDRPWVPTPGQPELTMPQWVDLHLQMMEEHLSAMKKIKPALDALYQVLTPEQRQKADQLIRMR